jgi:hypothetical protein
MRYATSGAQIRDREKRSVDGDVFPQHAACRMSGPKTPAVAFSPDAVNRPRYRVRDLIELGKEVRERMAALTDNRPLDQDWRAIRAAEAKRWQTEKEEAATRQARALAEIQTRAFVTRVLTLFLVGLTGAVVLKLLFCFQIL